SAAGGRGACAYAGAWKAKRTARTSASWLDAWRRPRRVMAHKISRVPSSNAAIPETRRPPRLLPLEPVGADEQAIGGRRPAPQELPQLGILLAEQVGVHEAAGHRLAAQARPTLEQRRHGLRRASPRRDAHLAVESTQNPLDALPRRGQEPAHSVVR